MILIVRGHINTGGRTMQPIYKWKIFESGSARQYGRSGIDSGSPRRLLPIYVEWTELISVESNAGNGTLRW
jgi:hypothetical protein